MTEIYEANRRKTIDENIERMRALGIPPPKQFFGALPMHEKKSKGSKKKVCEDDDEYLPSMDDNLLSSSSEDETNDLEEVTRMAPGRKIKNVIPSTSVPERRILVAPNQPPQCTRSEPSHPEPSSIAQSDQLESPHTIGSSVGSVSLIRRNVRGETRGKGTEKLVRQLGHAISVPIPSSSGAPEGEHVTSLVNEIGKEIRSSAPVHNDGWDKIDAGIREAIIMRVRQRFDVGDYENDLVIQDSIKKKCQKIYRNWKHKLHAHYLGLIEKGVADPKNHPPKRVEPNDWVSMINVWETEGWKTKSCKAKVSRSKLPYNHISGSRSFAATMSLIKSTNDGQVPSLPVLFKETHYQKNRKAWINEKAQDTYERLVNKTIEQSQPEVTSPMTELEISIDVLGRRPGYLKGYGIHIRGSSSSRSIAKSAERDAEVVALKDTVAMQAEQIASQAEQIASQAERIASQAEQMNEQAEQMNAQAKKTADLEALVHQLFAHSQSGASGRTRDFSSR